METDIDWKLCCLCQNRDATGLRSTVEGRAALGKQLMEFKSNQLDIPDIFYNFTDEKELVKHLNSNVASYHHRCHLNYSKARLERSKNKSVEQKVSQNSRKRSLSVQLGEHRCCICNVFDDISNLHRAAEVNKKPSKDFDAIKYLKEKTKEWKDLAATPGYENLHAKLCIGDLRSNELYYHLKCWSKLKRDNEIYIEASNTKSNTILKFRENYCMRKLNQYLYDLMYENPSNCVELREVFEKYQEICEALDVQFDPNITRFKTRLQDHISDDLQIIKSGKVLYIGWAQEIKDIAISAMKSNRYAHKMNDVANVLREDIRKFDKSNMCFQFETECEKNSVPPRLLSFMALLLEGDASNISRGVLTTSQIIVYNFRSKKQYGSESITRRHINNTPLVMYISLLLHNKYRCKDLLDELNGLGLCRGYQVMLEYNTALGNAEINHYRSQNVVVPSRLLKGLLITVAVDNVDQPTTSMTATSALHGTAISVTQHPMGTNDGVPQAKIVVNKSSTTKLLDLPEDFSHVPEVVMNDRVNISDESLLCEESFDAIRQCNIHADQIKKENEWLDEIRRIESLNDTDKKCEKPHWAAHHATKQNSASTKKVTNAVLPIFSESAATPGMMKHSLDIALSVTNFLNEGQLAVICADQPLYALLKKLQWHFPEQYGLKKIFCVMGGLHIEKQIEQVLGRYFEGSGIIDHLVASKVMTNSDNAFLSGSLITRTRYHYQVLATALDSSLKVQFEQSKEEDISVWIKRSCEISDQFKYWYLGLELILKFLIFVRSIRDADVDLYIDALCYWCRWFFIFDHPNYARYTSVHLVDLFNAKQENGSAYHLLKQGIFTANKTGNRFSNIHLDQNHEQLNDYLKRSGGIIGLTEDPAALKRFLVCAPLVADRCDDFKKSNGEPTQSPKNIKHHAESNFMQERFLRDKSAILETILSQGNPYNPNQKEILNIYTHEQALNSSIIHNLEENAAQIFEDYLEDVFYNSSQAIYVEIKQNNVDVFGAKNVKKDKTKTKLHTAKTCNKVVTNLFIATQQRDADMDKLFQYEISLPPTAFLSGAEVNMCKSKSTFMGCLVDESVVLPIQVKCSAVLVDGSYIAQSKRPKCVETIGAYVEQTYLSMISRYLLTHERVDLLFDRYFDLSIKGTTRVSRGIGGRYHIKPNTPIPRKWREFLRNSDNKTEMFRLVADYVSNLVIPEGKQIFCTKEDRVIAVPTAPVDGVSPCSHEEVDTRIVLHARDAAQAGHSSILMKASDIDIVVICVSLFDDIGAEELFVEYGTSKNLRLLPIHEIKRSLGPRRCRGILYFYGLTGGDAITAFVGYGKVAAWGVWMAFDSQFTDMFAKLSYCQSKADLTDEDFLQVEFFISAMYQHLKSFTPLPINDTRKKMFLTKGMSFEKLPPTRNVLHFKTLRALYQCIVWANSLVKEPNLPSVLDYGWQVVEKNLTFLWSTLPDVVKGCWDTFVKCNCKKSSCTKKCSCRKAGEVCTTLCGCNCYNA